MVINGYFIKGYWCLFHCKPLVVILLMVSACYFIISYCCYYMSYYDFW
jgi:hypothetical protein